MEKRKGWFKLGTVYFIGAGPGDFGLITLKGAETLKLCDVVIYDRLVNAEFLKILKPGCQKIYAGKQAGKHYMEQEAINSLLIKYALKENIVVRLKGGDPFVFGRTPEEIEALNQYNIPYEVIPGITSAIAVPEYAGIPVTKRDIARSFHVITGHTDKKTGGAPVCNYKSLVNAGGTLVFMMGLSNIKEITDNLLKEGMSEKTPATVISGGTTKEQKVLCSNLLNIAEETKSARMFSPAVIIIGETAADKYIYNYNKEDNQNKESINPGLTQDNRVFYNKKDNQDNKNINSGLTQDNMDFYNIEDNHISCKKKVGIVATKALAEKIQNGLFMSNTECIHVCGMEVLGMPDLQQELIEEIHNIEKYNWIIFTSSNSVKYFFNALKISSTDIRRLSMVKFAVIGSGTKKTLLNYGINADFIPSVYTSYTLAKELAEIIKPGENILLPRAVKGSQELTDILKQADISFKELKIYNVKGKLLPGADRLKELNCIIFLSASGVKEFARLLKSEGKKLPLGIKFICIGEVTKKAIEEEYGTKYSIITAKENNAEGVINIVNLEITSKCKKENVGCSVPYQKNM